MHWQACALESRRAGPFAATFFPSAASWPFSCAITLAQLYPAIFRKFSALTSLPKSGPVHHVYKCLQDVVDDFFQLGNLFVALSGQGASSCVDNHTMIRNIKYHMWHYWQDQPASHLGSAGTLSCNTGRRSFADRLLCAPKPGKGWKRWKLVKNMLMLVRKWSVCMKGT